MNDIVLTDDQCDALVAKVMDKIAAKASDQYGVIHALDLNPSITEHHSLRRSLVRAAYMLGELQAKGLLEGEIKNLRAVANSAISLLREEAIAANTGAPQ